MQNKTITPLQTLWFTLVGVVSVLLFAGVFLGIIYTLARTPVLEGPAAIGLALPAFVLSFVVATVTTIIGSWALLPRILGYDRMPLAICGLIAAIETYLLVNFALSPDGLLQPVTITAGITGILYAIMGFYTVRLPSPGKYAAMLAVIAVCGIGAYWQYYASFARRNVEGMNTLSYSLYIPQQTPGLPVATRIAPISDRHDNYERGVYVLLSEQNPSNKEAYRLVQTKAGDEPPGPACENGYGDQPIHEGRKNGFASFTCMYVGDVDGGRIYFREENDSNSKIKNQQYFAIIGNTQIWTPYIDTVPNYFTTKDLSDRPGYTDGTVAARGRQLLESLKPLEKSDYRLYAGRE